MEYKNGERDPSRNSKIRKEKVKNIMGKSKTSGRRSYNDMTEKELEALWREKWLRGEEIDRITGMEKWWDKNKHRRDTDVIEDAIEFERRLEKRFPKEIAEKEQLARQRSNITEAWHKKHGGKFEPHMEIRHIAVPFKIKLTKVKK